jgi:tetratricopeptide (TPR) repeat protein
MTKEAALSMSLAAIVGALVLGVGFSTGFFHPEPLSSDGKIKQDPKAIVDSAALKDAPSLVTRAQDRMALGQYSEAIIFLQAAARLTPGDPITQKMLAIAAFQNNDMILAANACEAALRLNPADADSQLGLARALFALDRLPSAAAACRAVVAMPSSSLDQREAARKILERIPLADQNREQETTYPITSAD